MAFKKGQSGNPGGRPKEDPELKELCKLRAHEAVATLVEVMKSKKSPAAARVTAACAILDRGYGKPMQTTELTGKDGKDLIPEPDMMEVARRLGHILASAAESA